MRLFALIFAFFLLVSPCFADVDNKDGATIDSDTNIDGAAVELDQADGATIDPAASDSILFDDGDGFESSSGWNPVTNPGDWDSFTNVPTLESSTVAVGSQSMECDAQEFMNKDHGAEYTELWVRFAVYIPTLAATRQIWKMTDAGPTNSIWISTQADDQLRVTDGTNNYDSTDTFTENAWNWIHVHIILGADGSETIQLSVSASSTFSSWDLNNTSATFVPTGLRHLDFGRTDAVGTSTYYFDDYIVWNQATQPSSF